ncbi:variable surface protein Vir 28, putative [Plasmodium vivax]|uniref:Variable surface protein Vir 28, putative n=1 Tax=Plasmodium vivax (strain Salvador I) TaxID=126793 RepID=A5KD17_PLAVS|nr:variable surface protein Vir 28, putative [Plasmodium vivax]EDL42751.1 variable surface protein Vir 28, putative [Plasmodium vivax]|eukprot:XP_001612544.1 variable surface protein Vir 28 [Plasmodium vivax Sal-1]
MEKHATDEVYLKYNDYRTLKEKFNRNPNYEYDLKSDDILKTYTVEESIKSTYKDAYKELFRHLHDGTVMSQYMIKGCKYISYMLHNEVIKKLKYDYNFETFNIFHNFVQAYYKYQKSYNNLCLPNMVYIDDYKYKKMDALYRLYDKYTKFVSPKIPRKTSSCEDLKFVVHLYNDYITDNKSTSKYLNDILDDFEKLLRSTIEKHKNGCTYDYTLTPIIKFIEENTQQHIKDNQETLEAITSTIIEKPSLTQQPEVTSPHDTSRHNEGTKIESETLASRESKGIITHALETHQTEEIHRAIRTGDDQEREIVTRALPDDRTLRTYSLYDPLGKLGLIPGGKSSEQLTLTQESSYNPQNGLEKDQKFLENVRNTITGVLGEVDPVPVVGVSGGMGALFLLFRVLKILHLRGRGPRRRIPNSFIGHIPGAFPEYDEYYDGHFTHGPINISYRPE